MPRFVTRFVVAVLLAIHATLLIYEATVNSPCNGEVQQLPAGISHWLFRRFDLYSVNPPLTRLVAAIPVIWANPALDWSNWRSDYPGARPDYAVGKDFALANGRQTFKLFLLARLACISFSLIGAYVCFRWADELYGPTSGIGALTLWCFSPNILAHAQLITPDATAASIGLTASYMFWKWLRRGGWITSFLAGVLLGLAQLSKTSWIILFALWPILWLVCLIQSHPRSSRTATTQLGQVCLILAVAVGVLNAGYGFTGTFSRLGSYKFVSKMLGGPQPPKTIMPAAQNRFSKTWLGYLPVPLPRDYVLGIDLQKRDFEQNETLSYLHGNWKLDGWWYYYLYGLAVKVPVGTLVLIAIRLFTRLKTSSDGTVWQSGPILLSTPLLLIFISSSLTAINHHVRYILPAFPFVFVWLSGITQCISRTRPLFSGLIILAFVSSVMSSLYVFPHSLSYFNEIAGGPLNGHAHLLHSNIDWGQDLLYLKDWTERHPEARPLRLAYDGYVNPRILNIPDLQTLEIRDKNGPVCGELSPGWYALSVNRIRSYYENNGCLLRLTPFARAGYSIYIYHVTESDIVDLESK